MSPKALLAAATLLAFAWPALAQDASLLAGRAELDWYDELKDWAATLGPALAILLAGVLGFWGVIHRQRADAREALKQRQAEEDRETQRRGDEARALAGALRAEIYAINKTVAVQRGVFEKHRDLGVEFNPYVVESLTPSMSPEIYLRNIERLTLLPSATVRAVVVFYVRCNQNDRILKQTSSVDDPSKLGEPYKLLADICGGLEKHGNNTVAVLDAFLAGEPPPEFQPIDDDARETEDASRAAGIAAADTPDQPD